MCNELEPGKKWVEETLRELFRGRNVEMWWWGEETDGVQHLLLQVVGGGQGESQAFPRDVLRDCATAHNEESRAQVHHRLVVMLTRLEAKGDR